MDIIAPKDKKKRIIMWVVIGVVILAALVVLYWYIFVYPKDEALKKSNKPATSLKKFVVSGGQDPSKKNNNILPTNNGVIAKMGSKGLQVKQLQRYLNQIKGAGIAEDGNWGPLTNAAFTNAKFEIQASAYSPNQRLDGSQVETAAKSGQQYYTELTETLYNRLQLANY